MGKLPGVKQLDFDCKTATLTMEEGASLSHEAATAALEEAGFGVTGIEGGEAPKVTAYLFRMTGIDPARPAMAQQALFTALDAPDFVAVDATGAAAVTLRVDEKASEAEFRDSLQKAGFGLEGFAVREWPKEPVVYVMEVPNVKGSSEAQGARDALVALEKVLWAEVHPERESALILLNEPCNEIEAQVRGALGALGHGVSQFRLEER